MDYVVFGLSIFVPIALIITAGIVVSGKLVTPADTHDGSTPSSHH
jgi:hypothetical protein